MTDSNSLVLMDRMLSSGLPIIGKPILIYTASIHGLSGSNDFSDWRCNGKGVYTSSGSRWAKSCLGFDSVAFGNGYGVGIGADTGSGVGGMQGAGFGICTEYTDKGDGDGAGYGDGLSVHGDGYIKLNPSRFIGTHE